jgi:regulator of extracellular matrix RemA (YlzA/DUF370 family)
MLGVSVPTIRNMVKDGRLEAKVETSRGGRVKYRVLRSAVEDLRNSRNGVLASAAQPEDVASRLRGLEETLERVLGDGSAREILRAQSIVIQELNRVVTLQATSAEHLRMAHEAESSALGALMRAHEAEEFALSLRGLPDIPENGR